MTLLKHGLEKDSQGSILITDILTGITLFEGYVRQCIHCQHTWIYKPGSGIRRGFCENCHGFTCGHPACDTCYHKEKQVEDIEAIDRGNRAAIEAMGRRSALREALGNELKDKRRGKGRGKD